MDYAEYKNDRKNDAYCSHRTRQPIYGASPCDIPDVKKIALVLNGGAGNIQRSAGCYNTYVASEHCCGIFDISMSRITRQQSETADLPDGSKEPS